MKKTIILLLAALLLASVVVADSNDADYLSVKYDRVACTVNFHMAVMTSIAGQVSQAANLSSPVTKLQDDLKQLQSLAQAGDHKAFRDYVGTLNTDMKSANDAVREVRKNYRGRNVSKDMRKSLMDSFKAGKTDFTNCVLQTTTKIGQSRYDLYSKAVQKQQAEVTKLDARNISTTELTSLIDDAQNTILTPLKAAIDTNDTTKVTSALKTYCLYNGCGKGTNFHFAAKIAIARLAAVLEKVTPKANAAGLASDVDAVQKQIDAARAALTAIGFSDYEGGQKGQLWGAIKGAEEALKKLRDDFKNANAGVK